jgi:ABC-type dipeptide/oligopeptide/nickel transport system permease subunit
MYKDGDDLTNWWRSIKFVLTELMAYVFALWTLKKSASFINSNDLSNKDSYLFQPNDCQIITIFRILGIGYKKMNYGSDKQERNCLIEVLTGEGKSLILGVSSAILALLGAEISCACYRFLNFCFFN